MKRILLLLVVISVPLFAQTKNPVTSVVQEILPRQQKNIVAAAEEMPADKFSFKPTPAQMSFGQLIVHITESNNYLCAKIGDLPAPKPAAAPVARTRASHHVRIPPPRPSAKRRPGPVEPKAAARPCTTDALSALDLCDPKAGKQ